MNPKSINMFLMDGNSSGRIKCSLGNWTGVIYKIPRNRINDCNELEVLKQSGIYLLLGEDDVSGRDVAYVGQGGLRKNNKATLFRVKEHNKSFWTEVLILTTTNNTLGKTEISFLEHTIHQIIKDSNRYILDNNITPNIGNVTEEKRYELLEFIENVKMICGTLGYKLFEPLNDISICNDSNLFYLERKTTKSNKTIKATCKFTNEGIVVLKGSQIEELDSSSITNSISLRRKNAKIENGILLEDELFNSPSSAASFVVGGSVNGWLLWKDANNINIKELI